MEECIMSTTGAIDGLFAKLGICANNIDILVTTCSIFCSTPSLSSMLVNHYKMKSTIEAYSLGGMGCSNGVIAVNLVRDMLKAHPNTNALFVCTEVVTPALYQGNDRHRLVTNVLFRLGATAVLMSNKPCWHGKSKYRLKHCVRVHTGARDTAYSAIHYSPDNVGLPGIYLGKDVVHEATRALNMAMSQIGPRVLTWRQLAQGAAYYARKAMMGKKKTQALPAPDAAKEANATPAAVKGGSGPAVTAAIAPTVAAPVAGTHEAAAAAPAGAHEAAAAAPAGAHDPDPDAADHAIAEAAESLASAAAGSGDHVDTPGPQEPPAAAAGAGEAAASAPAVPRRVSLVPADGFRPCFAESTAKHWLLHAGGAKILDGLGSAMKLPEYFLEPSRAVLHDYGNVSSSTTWYTLGYIETVRGVKAGDKVVQVGVGSGMKCGVNVFEALRDIDDIHPSWDHRVDEQRVAAAADAAVATKAAGARRFAVMMLLIALLVAAAAVWLKHVAEEGEAYEELVRRARAVRYSSMAWMK